MILDKELVFIDAATNAASTTTSAIDLGAGGDAVGQELTFHFVLKTKGSITAISSVAIQTCDTSGGTYTTLVQSGPLTLVEGEELFCVRVPKGLKRFVRIVITATGTGGHIVAFASKDL